MFSGSIMIQLLRIISARMKDVTTFILLHLAYLLGIGVTSLVAKLVGKHFLNMNPEGSSWKKHPAQNNLDTMY